MNSGSDPRQPECLHFWSSPLRARNRVGRRSSKLFETTCLWCGRKETRAGLARLKREVIDAERVAK